MKIISLLFEHMPNARVCLPYDEELYNQLIKSFLVILEQNAWNEKEMVIMQCK